jgi:hypothetical protein
MINALLFVKENYLNESLVNVVNFIFGLNIHDVFPAYLRLHDVLQ